MKNMNPSKAAHGNGQRLGVRVTPAGGGATPGQMLAGSAEANLREGCGIAGIGSLYDGFYGGGEPWPHGPTASAAKRRADGAALPLDIRRAGSFPDATRLTGTVGLGSAGAGVEH
jgi:hypothetical protein